MALAVAGWFLLRRLWVGPALAAAGLIGVLPAVDSAALTRSVSRTLSKPRHATHLTARGAAPTANPPGLADRRSGTVLAVCRARRRSSAIRRTRSRGWTRSPSPRRWAPSRKPRPTTSSTRVRPWMRWTGYPTAGPQRTRVTPRAISPLPSCRSTMACSISTCATTPAVTWWRRPLAVAEREPVPDLSGVVSVRASGPG